MSDTTDRQGPIPRAGAPGNCDPAAGAPRIEIFPGTGDDELVLPLPSGPGPDEPAGVGPLAFAVHVDRLGSTRERSAARAPLDDSAVELLRASLQLTSSLQVPRALRALVESACSLTGATWGTIAVYGRSRTTGRRSRPVSAGPASASPEHLDTLLGRPRDDGVVIVNDLSATTAFTGVIEGEDPGCILSAPLRAHHQGYGRLYLCDKPGGFTCGDVTTVQTLAQAAAIAVENARLYREARSREQWMAVSQELTTLLLSGAEEDDALILVARRIREVAHADTVALILPSVGDAWACEIADGAHAAELIGTFFPARGRALRTLEQQTGLTVPSLHEAWGAADLLVEPLARFGPALYAPMLHRGRGVGVILLLREQGAPTFTDQDLEIAELVAGQATMAFELADAQHAQEMATLLDERARIARDLHDLAIQQLFAAGMQISSARERLSSAGGAPDQVDVVCRVLDSSLAAVDDSVGQIRSIVRSLRDRDEDVSLVERLRRESSLARTLLGFAPSLLLSVDGRALALAGRAEEDELISAVDAAVDPEVADDMVAVVREGLSNVARHAHASSVTVDVMLTGVVPGGGAEPAMSGSTSSRPAVSGPGGAEPAVEIVCRDDGVGVDPGVTRRSGTANMAERARRHGGSFVIGPRARTDGASRGTCFTWRVPLAGRPVPDRPGPGRN